MSHAALVIPTIDLIGGAERQVLVLAAGLRRRGWNVTVVALAGTGGEAAAALKTAGAREVFLFGSAARGTMGAETDIDLAVTGEQLG